MAEKQRTGLVSYGGDSEISDNEIEDENMLINTTPPRSSFAPQVMLNSFGIPSSKPRTPSSPPDFVRPIVRSAPRGGLVANYGDLDDSVVHHDEVFQSEESGIQEELPQSPTTKEEKQAQQEDSQPDVEITDLTQDSENHSPNSLPLFLPVENVHLPPEPTTTKCSKSLQEKVKTLLQKQAVLGIDLNKSVQERKDFRNPSIYKKLIDFCNLDEFGTNYPEHLYNPHEWKEEDYHDNLLKAQKKAHEKRERGKLERGKVEFVTGTKRPAPPSQGLLGAPPGLIDPNKKQRRTKWDLGTGSGAESGGSRGTSPTGTRLPLLGTAPGLAVAGLQGTIGAQAKAQASLLNIEITRTK